MDTPATCGEGLAEHSSLPATLARLLEAMAHNLTLHRGTLDPHDPVARREQQAYATLEQHFQGVVTGLRAAAAEMAGAHALPMGKHLDAKLDDPAIAEAFVQFVRIEMELMALLERDLERDRSMLTAMRVKL